MHIHATSAPAPSSPRDITSLATPTGFAREILHLPLYPWQEEILTWFEDPRGRAKMAVSTPNGAGKSSVLIAAAALWCAALHPRARVVITSRDARQIEQQVWPAIERHITKFAGWRMVRSPSPQITTPSGSVILAFTTSDASRAEGWHRSDDVSAPLMMIVDEAKSIDEQIFRALDRCTYNWLLYVSSPGGKTGRFHDAFTKNRADYKTRRVGLLDCPHIPKERIDDIVRTYGESHPFTRSTLHGEFMTADDLERYVVSVDSLERCLRNPPPAQHGPRTAFCDFAKGTAENALCVRSGNRVEQLVAWRESDEMAAVGQFILRFRALRLRPSEIFGDCGGEIGTKMCDLLAEAGWPIGRINFGQRASQPETYVSWASEAWHELARRIDKCEVILPPDDTLRAQLTSRKRNITARGALELESKFEMQRRGLISPDRADAVAGAFHVAPQPEFAGVPGLWQWPPERQEAALWESGLHAGV